MASTPHLTLENYILPKACLPQFPWEYTDQKEWTDCNDKKIRLQAGIQTFTIVIILLIILIVIHFAHKQPTTWQWIGGAAVLGVLMTFIWVISPWWKRLTARKQYEIFDVEFGNMAAAVKASDPTKTFDRQDFIKYKMEQQKTQAASLQASAAAAIGLSQVAQTGTMMAHELGGLFGHKK